MYSAAAALVGFMVVVPALTPFMNKVVVAPFFTRATCAHELAISVVAEVIRTVPPIE